MSSTSLLTVVHPESTSTNSNPGVGKFARLRKSEKPLVTVQGTTESALGTALSTLASRQETTGSQEPSLRGVRFHLTRNEPCGTECNPLHEAHQQLLVRLYWRGAGSASAAGLHEWALENSRIRGRLAAFNRDEIQLSLQVEVPCGSLLEVRVIDALCHETDMRGKVIESSRGSDGEWLVRCRLFAPLNHDQILELCGQ